jgi:hypothetical protein
LLSKRTKEKRAAELITNNESLQRRKVKRAAELIAAKEKHFTRYGWVLCISG